MNPNCLLNVVQTPNLKSFINWSRPPLQINLPQLLYKYPPLGPHRVRLLSLTTYMFSVSAEPLCFSPPASLTSMKSMLFRMLTCQILPRIQIQPHMVLRKCFLTLPVPHHWHMSFPTSKVPIEFDLVIVQSPSLLHTSYLCYRCTAHLRRQIADF